MDVGMVVRLAMNFIAAGVARLIWAAEILITAGSVIAAVMPIVEEAKKASHTIQDYDGWLDGYVPSVRFS